MPIEHFSATCHKPPYTPFSGPRHPRSARFPFFFLVFFLFAFGPLDPPVFLSIRNFYVAENEWLAAISNRKYYRLEIWPFSAVF
ncbi:MAG TPA: hypothetical protein VMB47_12805, partial [Candidatus Aquilonibacter sp.]|nr:hypothetical protein [Candidatus Aquilonibacter sp.]